MSFPAHPLAPIAVHYSDAYTPYGPFLVGRGMLIAVLRQRRAAQFYMSDPQGHKLRNPSGRELYGQSVDVPWEELSGDLAGVSRKTLIGKKGQDVPQAGIWQYAPERAIQWAPAPFGRFHILLEGDALLGDRRLEPYSMAYACGDDRSPVFRAGEAGATWLALTFAET